MYIGRHVKCQLCFPDLIKPEFSGQILEKKYIYIKYNQNYSIGIRIVPYGRTDRRIYVTQLIGALLNFANSPKQITYPKVISWNITPSNRAY